MYSATSLNEQPPRQTGSVEDRMIAGMRFVLASSALLIIWLDPVEPDRLVHVTYAALLLYTLYSLIVGALVWRRRESIQRFLAWSHWADVASYAFLIALSSGTNSIFFFGFFFAIVTSSFRFGYRTGLRVTVASALLFTTVSLVTAPLEAEFELNRFLLRPVDLAVLGYMISYWVGFQVKLSRRLELLKDVSRLSNPRYGLDRTIGSILEQLRAFYDGDACVFVSSDPHTSEFRLRRADARDPDAGARSEVIDPHLANQLVHLLGDQTVVHTDARLQPGRWLRRFAVTSDKAKDKPDTKVGVAVQTAANLLDANSFVTVPLRQRDKVLGRVYVTSRKSRAFDRTDAAFLVQVAEHVVSVLEHTRLIDRLATEAAEQERKRIARDIHDSIIQPYIGLQMGLVGVRRRLSTDTIDVDGNDYPLLKIVSEAASDTDRLIEMTTDGISDLRGYVHVLREKGDSEDSFMPALRRFAAKFTQATNIIVQVRADTDIQVDDQIGAEVFQVIVEGLSNIRRHTQSERAFIGLECSDNRLTLRVENDGTRGIVPEPFTPQSIAERAKSLGGRAYVETFGDAGTSVIVEIPL
jgi:signal transduction histidine kinase